MVELLSNAVTKTVQQKSAIVILIVLGFFFSENAFAQQPTITFAPNQFGEINVDIVDNTLDAHFGKSNNRGKEFVVEFGAGVTSIGDSAFYDCTNLILTALPEMLITIGKWSFYKCEKLSLTKLPPRVTTIGDEAFTECYKLSLKDFPTSLVSIGDWAFTVCTGLTSITLPTSLKIIGMSAFANCSNLKEVIALTTIPLRLEFAVFEKVDPNCILFVPGNALDAYKNSDWSIYFQNRIQTK